MAMNSVNSALSKLVIETRLDMLSKVKDFLKEKLEMEEEELNELVEEFKNSIDLKVKEEKSGKKNKKEDNDDKPKKKRVAGPYNLFLGAQIKLMKAADPESKESKKFMAKAQEEWKALKEQYPEMATDSAKLYEQWQKDIAV